MDAKQLGNTYFHAMPDSVRHDYESGGGVHGSVGITLRQHFAGLVDVSVYMPMHTYEKANGRRPSVQELAAYIAEIRLIEADALLSELAKET